MYYQHPALHSDSIAFVSGNALWIRTRDAHNPPYKLTDSLPNLSHPHFSPDGQTIVFVSEKDVHSIAVSSPGSQPNPITAHEGISDILGWKDDRTLWAMTSAVCPHGRERTLTTIDMESGFLHHNPIGPCEFSSFSPTHGHIIQREGYGYISWKRYTGGLAGTLWLDSENNGTFTRILKDITHNLLCPIWIRDRIYFLCDKDGYGNIYSCDKIGNDLRQETQHTEFYPRQISAHGTRLIYSYGGKIWVYDTEEKTASEITLHTHQGALSQIREVKDPATHLTSYALSPDGKRLALTTRGRLFDLTPTTGPCMQKGLRDSVRYRWVSWFKDNTMVALHDQGLKEVLEFYSPNTLESTTYAPADVCTWGRLVGGKPNPQNHSLACTNHRHELLWIQLGDVKTLDSVKTTVIAKSKHFQIKGYDWSPCGRWLTYNVSMRLRGSSIFIYDTETNQHHDITGDAFQNTDPIFDRDGKYLFFLSSRQFHAERDNLDIAMACSSGAKPFVFILQEKQESLFALPILQPEAEKSNSDLDKNGDKDSGEDKTKSTESDGAAGEKTISEKDKPITPVLIDFSNPEARILAFPIKRNDVIHLYALKNMILYSVPDEDEGKTDLYAFDFKQIKEDCWITGCTDVVFSLDNQWMSYTSNNKLRTVATSSKPEAAQEESFNKGGWLDWGRVVLTINPQKEWVHMFDEAWYLQKEMFWTSCLGKVDWEKVYQKYRPCIDQITCKSELYSVIADMHGELGTSHAYIYDNPAEKTKPSTRGSLGATFSYVPEKDAYRIDSFLQGDAWWVMPLQRPGLDIHVGDLIFSIAGNVLSKAITPNHALLLQAGNSIPMQVGNADGENKRTVYVFPQSASKEPKWRYRQWVESNRKWVHEHSGGAVGYVHIPDMSLFGYSEFLRGYTQDFDRDGLIIDARYNGGGNLSYFMIDMLRRKRLGNDRSRHHGSFPYPSDAPKGPMVCLVNGNTGSDGDVFSYAFKKFKMGELIGKRTWGGVVGIWPRYNLIDGTSTTQPEFAFWFHDEGWSIENKGVTPTIDVDITPQDYAKNKDPQLECGLQQALIAIENDRAWQEKLIPTPGSEPNLAAPARDPNLIVG